MCFAVAKTEGAKHHSDDCREERNVEDAMLRDSDRPVPLDAAWGEVFFPVFTTQYVTSFV